VEFEWFLRFSENRKSGTLNLLWKISTVKGGKTTMKVIDIMEAHDAVKRPYLTEDYALACEILEIDNLQYSICNRRILPVYVIDDEIILSCQMAAFLQYQSKEMWCIYFAGEKSRYLTGTILRISKVNPGDI